MDSITENYVSGSYAVGTETFSFTDTGRKEILGNADGYRKIAVRMYYPVFRENVSGKKNAPVLSERKAKAVCKAYFIRKISVEMMTANYYENVPIADDAKFPLILFNHGYNSYIEANTCLCIDIASHGYIIASVGHSYEAVETDFDSESCVLYDKHINKMMFTSIPGAMFAQSKLLKKKLSPEEAYAEFCAFQNKYTPFIKGRVSEWEKDNLSALAEIKKRYAAYIDSSCGTGVSGHSLGGAEAYNLCMNDPEFTCGINIDGALFGDYGEKTMERPFYQICCKENFNAETKPMLNSNAPVYYAIFENMKHIGFTDAKFFLSAANIVGKMDGNIMHRHLSDIHIKFFNKYLKGADINMPVGESDGVIYK